MGEQIYYHAWDIDLSPVYVDPREEVWKGFSNGMILTRDYSKEAIGYSKTKGIHGFNHSKTLPKASNISKHLSRACIAIMSEENVSGMIRSVHVSVANLVRERLFNLIYSQVLKMKSF